jgi:hypothetical protein
MASGRNTIRAVMDAAQVLYAVQGRAGQQETWLNTSIAG